MKDAAEAHVCRAHATASTSRSAPEHPWVRPTRVSRRRSPKKVGVRGETGGMMGVVVPSGCQLCGKWRRASTLAMTSRRNSSREQMHSQARWTHQSRRVEPGGGCACCRGQCGGAGDGSWQPADGLRKKFHRVNFSDSEHSTDIHIHAMQWLTASIAATGGWVYHNAPTRTTVATTAIVGGATVGAAVVGTVFLPPIALYVAGFGAGGVVSGSIAAAVQSVAYGATTTGVFSALTSAGATGVIPTVLSAAGGTVGAVVGGGVGAVTAPWMMGGGGGGTAEPAAAVNNEGAPAAAQPN